MTSASGKVVICMSCFIFFDKAVVMTISTITITPTIILQSASTNVLVIGLVFGPLAVLAIIAVVMTSIVTLVLYKRKKSLRYFIALLYQHMLYYHAVNQKTWQTTQHATMNVKLKNKMWKKKNFNFVKNHFLCNSHVCVCNYFLFCSFIQLRKIISRFNYYKCKLYLFILLWIHINDIILHTMYYIYMYIYIYIYVYVYMYII